MALNRDFVNRDLPVPEPYEVGREKLREFATSIGDANPAYHSRDAARALGHPDIIAPPTFAIVLSLRASRAVLFDPELGLDYSRAVHGEQRFVHIRPIRAGDVLVTHPRITDIRAAGANELLTWEAQVTTVDGEPVCTTTNTVVVRGASG